MRAAPLVVDDPKQAQRRRLYAMAGGGLGILLLVWLVIREKTPAAAPERPEIARITKLEEKKDTKALIEATRSEDPEVAQRAIDAASRVGGSAILEQLQPTLRDRRPAVREVALTRYAELTDRDHVDAINDVVLHDPSPGVRATAAKSLGQLRSWNGMETLLAGLSDRDPFVRRCAFEAIKTITGAHYVYNPDGTPAES